MDHAIKLLTEELSRSLEGDPRRTSSELEMIEELQFAIAALQGIREGHLKQPETFEEKIAAAINHYSLEAGSDTPDFILAAYLKRCLDNFDLTMQHRATWFEPSDGAEDAVPPIEQAYRMLEVGEVIQEGDEWQRVNSESWEKVEVRYFGIVVNFRNVRRPVPEPEALKYRMLEEGEILLNSDEFNYGENEWESSGEGGYKVPVGSVGRYRRPL